MQTLANPDLAHVGGFRALDDEHDYVVPRRDVRGEIPASIRGTFFRIGPGRNEIGGVKFGHWFDGDGMVHSVTFFDDGVRYRNRYVRTPKYVAETRAQRIVKRSFGHNIPGGWHKNVGRLLANCANTNVAYHGGRLLALWEGGQPYHVDPATLDTIGRFTFGGALSRLHTFSAHGSPHPSGAYYNFGLRPNLKGRSCVDLYKIAPSGYLVQRGQIEVDFFGFLHDFALTEHHALFFVSPLAIRNPIPALLGFQTFDQAMRWQPELGMKIHVVRLDDFDVQKVIEVDPFVAIHCSNAWEDSGRIHVDVTAFDDFRVSTALRNVFTERADTAADFVRFEIELANGRVTSRKHEKVLPCEFPQWDPRRQCRPTRFVYLNAIVQNGTDGMFNAVQRLDTATGEVVVHDFGPNRFTSEALFVPNAPSGQEDDGHVICAVYDAREHRSEIVILDAGLQREVAVVPLRNHIPHGFHCGYVDQRFA